jgi:heterodisulfide reductase subunit A
VGEATIEAITAEVEENLCGHCLICLSACPFNALVAKEKAVEVLQILCKGCGSCAAACPTGAIQMRHFTDEQILAELREAMKSH